MYTKFLVLLVVLGFGLQIYTAQGQKTEFDKAITAIMHDAPEAFRDVRGKEVNNSYNALVWESGIKVPGTVASRFVFAKGMYYEGALMQAPDSSALRTVYQSTAMRMDSLLLPQGYSRVESENFYPNVADFPKIAWLPARGNDSKGDDMPPHLALEVTYSKKVGNYTVVMYIYQH